MTMESPQLGALPSAGKISTEADFSRETRRLWSNSPAWRKLVVASGGLVALAISAPIVLPGLQPTSTAPSVAGPGSLQADPNQQTCALHQPTAPTQMLGRVARFVTPEESAAAFKVVEAEVGGKVSPTFAALKRVSVDAYPPANHWSTLAAVPDYLTVLPGDIVELNSRYRDTSLPCNFVPWTVVGLANVTPPKQ